MASRSMGNNKSCVRQPTAQCLSTLFHSCSDTVMSCLNGPVLLWSRNGHLNRAITARIRKALTLQVYQGLRNGVTPIAVKFVLRDGEHDAMSNLRNEVEVMKACNDPHIVKVGLCALLVHAAASWRQSCRDHVHVQNGCFMSELFSGQCM